MHFFHITFFFFKSHNNNNNNNMAHICCKNTGDDWICAKWKRTLKCFTSVIKKKQNKLTTRICSNFLTGHIKTASFSLISTDFAFLRWIWAQPCHWMGSGNKRHFFSLTVRYEDLEVKFRYQVDVQVYSSALFNLQSCHEDASTGHFVTYEHIYIQCIVMRVHLIGACGVCISYEPAHG